MPEAATAHPAAATAPVLAVETLRLTYGAVTAVKDVSLDVSPGEVVALLGANGAGKTTMLRAISGLVRPRAGSIRFLGERIDRLSPSRIVRLGIAHCPEGRRVFGSLTVAENLRLGAAARIERTASRRTASASIASFPSSRSAVISTPGPFPAASSRCSRSAAR